MSANINRDSGIEIPEAWMPTISPNMTTDFHHSGPLRDQFLPLTVPTMLWIETHQPWARFVIHQSLTTTEVHIVRLSKATLSPDEDLQCAVESMAINIKVTHVVGINLAMIVASCNWIISKRKTVHCNEHFRAWCLVHKWGDKIPPPTFKAHFVPGAPTKKQSSHFCGRGTFKGIVWKERNRRDVAHSVTIPISSLTTFDC